MPTAELVPILDEDRRPLDPCQTIIPEQEWPKEPAVEQRGHERTKEVPSAWRERRISPKRTVEEIRALLTAEVSRTHLLDLKDDWDGEGSTRYLKDTVDRAIGFAATQAHLLSELGFSFQIPDLGPGPNGSIDLHWKKASCELLVNIPADAGEMVTFYGDDYKTQHIRGSINVDSLNWGIAEWLMK
jgi:hypothetical protein